MSSILGSSIGILAWQPLWPAEASAPVRWMIVHLIRPDFQTHPAARQAALAGVLSVTLAAALAAILAFLFKLWRDNVALSRGARDLARGPRRSLAALVLWLFLFILVYAAVFYLLAPDSARLIGVANIMTLISFGAVVYVAVFLLLHLPVHRTHMPWRGVQ